VRSEDTKPTTSKRDAAIQQIHAAIEHCQKGQLAPAITLGAAAEGSLPRTDNEHLIKRINDLGLFKELDMNAVINWLKHDTGQPAASLLELEAGVTVMRAISKFASVYNGVTPTMKAFPDWMVGRGHFATEPKRNDLQGPN
jgi:hypothetical protein